MRRPRKVARARDAASLILTRHTPTGLEVLLGRRPASARFMPEVYVFPGGALEPEDRLRSGLPESFAALPPGTDAATEALHPALIRCALRELHEETGLLLTDGDLTPSSSPSAPVWCRYRATARRPGFAGLSLVYRAVTPPELPIRFDTRFFRADRIAIEGRLAGSGELEDLAWHPLSTLDTLPLRRVTRAALAATLAASGSGIPASGGT